MRDKNEFEYLLKEGEGLRLEFKEDNSYSGINLSENVENSDVYMTFLHKFSICLILNKCNMSNRIINNKKEKGLAEWLNPKKLSIDYGNYSKWKYLNISIVFFESCAGMAEWLTQSTVNRCPSGHVGPIPTAGAAFSEKFCIKKWNLFSEVQKTEKIALNPGRLKRESLRIIAGGRKQGYLEVWGK